jgi:beta-lactamase class D
LELSVSTCIFERMGPMIGRPATALLLLALGVPALSAGAARTSPQQVVGVRTCVVIQPPNGPSWQSDSEACAVRLSPASTFKIPHALVGLETGAVTATTSEKWDGTKYANQPGWNHDHTVLTAMKPSVLWFFQRMAPRIGAARMHGWLQRLGYGNADTSGDVTAYWVNGRLRVSATEQAAFLSQFFTGTLPFAQEHQRAVRAALQQAPGTVENARGVHRIDGDWAGLVLTSKTGATTTADGQGVSWLVGAVVRDRRHHVFASAAWNDGGPVDSLEATHLAVRTLIARGVVPPSLSLVREVTASDVRHHIP